MQDSTNNQDNLVQTETIFYCESHVPRHFVEKLPYDDGRPTCEICGRTNYAVKPYVVVADPDRDNLIRTLAIRLEGADPIETDRIYSEAADKNVLRQVVIYYQTRQSVLNRTNQPNKEHTVQDSTNETKGTLVGATTRARLERSEHPLDLSGSYSFDPADRLIPGVQSVGYVQMRQVLSLFAAPYVEQPTVRGMDGFTLSAYVAPSSAVLSDGRSLIPNLPMRHFDASRYAVTVTCSDAPVETLIGQDGIHRAGKAESFSVWAGTDFEADGTPLLHKVPNARTRRTARFEHIAWCAEDGCDERHSCYLSAESESAARHQLRETHRWTCSRHYGPGGRVVGTVAAAGLDDGRNERDVEVVKDSTPYGQAVTIAWLYAVLHGKTHVYRGTAEKSIVVAFAENGADMGVARLFGWLYSTLHGRRTMSVRNRVTILSVFAEKAAARTKLSNSGRGRTIRDGKRGSYMLRSKGKNGQSVKEEPSEPVMASGRFDDRTYASVSEVPNGGKVLVYNIRGVQVEWTGMFPLSENRKSARLVRVEHGTGEVIKQQPEGASWKALVAVEPRAASVVESQVKVSKANRSRSALVREEARRSARDAKVAALLAK